MWDSVPWFVGGGAQHTPDVARVLAYNALRGNEGIQGPRDLQVRSLDVPGPQVRVLSGAAGILNRTPGYAYQAYAGRLPNEDVLDIGNTGSAGGRSDLVMARVEDPTLSGTPWQAPDDVTVGPYIFSRIEPDVDPGTTTVVELGKGYSAIALARIDIPASTGTITQDMITDLRTVANPRRDRRIFTYALEASQQETQTATSTEGEYWPNLARWDMRIPEWATHAKVRGEWVGVLAPGGNVYGRCWVGIGVQGTPNELKTQQIRYDTTGLQNNYRFVLACVDDINIPASMRGQVKRFGLRAFVDATQSAASRIRLDWASGISLDIEFQEQADAGATQIGV